MKATLQETSGAPDWAMAAAPRRPSLRTVAAFAGAAALVLAALTIAVADVGDDDLLRLLGAARSATLPS